MLRQIEKFDQDLISYATLIVCPDGEKREFLGFDEEGDLIVNHEANGLNGVVHFEAGKCYLVT